MRDGVPYDQAFRTRMAMRGLRESRVRQPRKVPRPPGPNGAVLLINQLTGRELMIESIARLPRQYPRIAYLRLRGEHAYVLTHPETVLEVFQSQSRDTTKSRGLQVAKAVLGEGLLTSEGAEHLRARRMIQPAFHQQRIAQYADQMAEWARLHSRGWHDGQRIEVVADMSALTLSIVGSALFGSDLSGDAAVVGESLTNMLNSFQRLLLPAGFVLSRLPLPSARRLEVDARRLDELVQRVISEHRISGDTGDLLSMMISAQDEGFEMDDAQLRDEVMTLILAGHETTAMALSWCWYLLAQNPLVGERLRAELDGVLAGRDPEFGDLSALPFTYACVAETMRLFPPAWIYGRRASKDLEVDGWRVPRGSVIMASPYALHRDPRFWEAAGSFRPQRWISETAAFDESAPGQPRGAWATFGFSNRRCIGDQFAWVEAVMVLATLAQRWELKLVPGTSVTLKPAVTLRPGGGIPMTVHAI